MERWPAGRSPGYLLIRPHQIAAYLGDLRQAVSGEGKLALFFPDSLTLAAPFLLFRLKREGYSNCRAWSEAGGVVVTADR